MQNIMINIRNKYHPLFHLRKFTIFKKITRFLDIPVSIRFPVIGHRIVVSLTKNLSFVLSSGSAGEEKERNNFARIVSFGQFKSFFDVGANIGIYSFLFKSLVPQGRVVMFEPDPQNAKLILLTLAQSNLQNMELIEAAASDIEGTIAFFKDELSGATGAIASTELEVTFGNRHHGAVPAKIVVKTVTLDAICLRKIDPDFIKIDVEGAEMSVFVGAMSLIKRASPAIFFECDSGNVNIA